MKSKESVPKQSEPISALIKRRKALADYIDAMPYKPKDHWDFLTNILHDFEVLIQEIRNVQTEGNDCSSETPLKSQTPVPPSLPSILQEEKEGNGE